ncbi:hypothetical protein IJ596_08290 [bacterium]|nr:hypothetical protein [bacterium]
MKISEFHSDIDINKRQTPNFRANPMIGLAVNLDEKVLLGKAVLDVVSLDAPQVIMANNNQERREKFNKSLFSFALGYLSPLVTLPLTNRFAMKYIGKLTKSFWTNNHKAIHISNKFLKDAEPMMAELTRMAKGVKKNPFEEIYYKLNSKKQYNPRLNIDELLKSCGGDKEKLRQKLINAKNAVLAFDLLFTSASIGCVGFFNNWQTKRKTKQDGYSAEFYMADKSIVEKRAESYKKKEPLRKAAWLGVLTALTLCPLLIKKGLTSQTSNAFNNYIKKIAPRLDYNDGIYMSRLALLLASFGIYSGITLASRNQTELKDTSIRSTVSTITYFGGDILIGSILGRLADKYLKTNIINKDIENAFIRKLIPPTKRLRSLDPRDKKIGAILYWVNLAMLSVCMGFGIPYLINKMIRHDVEKDVNAQNKTNLYIKRPRMEDFVKG